MRTDGISPKVPTQAVVTLIVAALAYFGIELDAEAAGALGVLAGALAGAWAPPGDVRPVRQNDPRDFRS